MSEKRWQGDCVARLKGIRVVQVPGILTFVK